MRESWSVWTRDLYADAAFFSLYVAIIFLISAMALPGFKPCGTRNSDQRQTSAGPTSPELSAVYLRAGSGAVHDGVTAVQRERVLEFGEPLLGEVVARVDHPAVRLRHKHKTARLPRQVSLKGERPSSCAHLHEDGRAQILVSVPPVAGTAGAAAGAQDTLVQAVLTETDT